MIQQLQPFLPELALTRDTLQPLFDQSITDIRDLCKQLEISDIRSIMGMTLGGATAFKAAAESAFKASVEAARAELKAADGDLLHLLESTGLLEDVSLRAPPRPPHTRPCLHVCRVVHGVS